MSISDSDAGELIPELVRQGMQALIEPESTAAIGVDRHRCTAKRLVHRNGSRNRRLATPAAGQTSLSGPARLIPRFERRSRAASTRNSE